MNTTTMTMTLENFADLLDYFPPDTDITGPTHLPGAVSVWTTTDEAGESAVYVVTGDEVSRITLTK